MWRLATMGMEQLSVRTSLLPLVVMLMAVHALATLATCTQMTEAAQVCTC
jgi:hypothetical protein